MVDTVGNRLGPRKTFVYIRDDSVQYNIRLDESVSLALGNTPSTNGGFPKQRASEKYPTEPRYVLLSLKSDPNIRKKAIVCDYTNSLFLSNLPTEVTINNVIWIITARIGEKRSTYTVDDPE